MTRLYTRARVSGALILAVTLLLGMAMPGQATETDQLLSKGPSFERYVQEHGLDKYVGQVHNGIQLMGLDPHGEPYYNQTYNLQAARTSRADQLWQSAGNGYNLSGAWQFTMAVWDAGTVRATHQEFNEQGWSRVTNRDTTPIHFHATHVAGTMAAYGIEGGAIGMSYKGQLDAYDWNYDSDPGPQGEMRPAAASGIRISNHSYGQLGGWNYDFDNGAWHWYGSPNVSETEDWKFGYYGSQSAEYDDIAYDYPYYTICVAAGNDRDETGPGPGGFHYIGGGTGQGSNVTRDPDGGYDGYDCVSDKGVSKNTFTVGAVNDVPNYYGPDAVGMSSFSCWGPTDDGRIKPDIVANGVGLTSTGPNGDSDYFSSSGTSMATPSAAGTLNLLLQHYRNLFNNNDPLSSTLRGLAIHTADEAGDWPGPDYSFGWGLLNALRAARFLDYAALNPIAIQEMDLANGEEYSLEITPLAEQPIRITLMWTDFPSSPLPYGSLNDPSPRLVNDLDVRLVETGTETTYYPYVLGGLDNPSAPATTGDNTVDVVEMVYLEDVPDGTYEVRVSHKGSLLLTQTYSLLISGALDANDPRLAVEGLESDIDYAAGEAMLSWSMDNPGPTFEEYVIYRDGVQVGATTNTSFNDPFPGFGVYEYEVRASYAEGESLVNPTVNVWFPEPVQAHYLGYSIVDEENDIITLAWEQSRLEEIFYDQGEGVGGNQAFVFSSGVSPGTMAAQRMTSVGNGSVHSIEVYIGSNAPFGPFKLNVLEGTDDPYTPGEIVASSEELQATESGWFHYDLPTRVLVDEGDDYWVALEWLDIGTTQIVIDTNEDELDNRSMLYHDLGGGDFHWEALTDFQGGILAGDLLLRSTQGVVEAVGENGLVEYNVYRDGEVIATTSDWSVEETVPAGQHEYMVESVYEQGTASSETITVEAGNLPVVDDKLQPVSFEIGDAYPNPFNPSVAVPISLGKPSQVRVLVYDVLGRQVAELNPGRLAAGTHSVSWTAEGVSSGVYFLRVQAGPLHSTQKVVLMR